MMKNDLIIGVSTVADGNMSVNWGDEETVNGNRERFLGKWGIKIEDCVKASLLSGTDIKVVGKEDKGKMYECDALVTTEKDLPLWMVVGDCLPVVIYDPVKKAVALVHLGWRGVEGKLVQKVIKILSELGSQNKDLEIWIGPGVRKGTFKKWDKGWDEFVQAVGDNMEEWEEFIEDTNDGKKTLDLVGYVIKQMTENKIAKNNIMVSPIDTVTDTNYFSHHRAYFTKEQEGRFGVVVLER